MAHKTGEHCYVFIMCIQLKGGTHCSTHISCTACLVLAKPPVCQSPLFFTMRNRKSQDCNLSLDSPLVWASVVALKKFPFDKFRTLRSLCYQFLAKVAKDISRRIVWLRVGRVCEPANRYRSGICSSLSLQIATCRLYSEAWLPVQ